MRFKDRRGPPVRLIAGASLFVILGLVGAVFWYAHKAESNPPVQQDLRVEATNVGPY